MEDHISKICPLCKTEIKEGDVVKVCTSCNIPHHETCWEKNKGCSTSGCSEQHHEEQAVKSVEACVNCGSPLEEDQEFCTDCGTPRGDKKLKVCSNCGSELQDGQLFCPKCGQKVGLQVDVLVNSGVSPLNTVENKAYETVKKKPVRIIIAVIVVALVAIFASVLLIPKLFISVDDLCAKGEYAKAYEKAGEDVKLEIKAESIVAKCSSISVDKLKDPSSFKLRGAYYNEGTNEVNSTPTGQVVLYMNATNSYGGSVASYFLFIWETDKNEWSYYLSVSDLDDEEYKTYDDYDEKLEKLVNNVGRLSIRNTMSSGIKLSEDAVKRINDLFEAGTLDAVEPISRIH